MCAPATRPARAASERPAYTAASWSVRDGLPVGACETLLQSRDGYLWLGTEDGLARFDGVRFRVFDRQSVPTLKSDHFRWLAETTDGTLWFKTDDGTVGAFRNGVVTDSPPDSLVTGIQTRRLEPASDGSLWVTTTRGLLHFANGRWQAIHSPLLEKGTLIASDDGRGGVWVSTPYGAAHVTAAGVKPYKLRAGPDDHGWWQPDVDAAGRVWLATETGVRILEGDTFVPYTPAGLPPSEPWRVFFANPSDSMPCIQSMFSFAWHRDGEWHYKRPGTQSLGRIEPGFEGRLPWYAIGQDVYRDDALVFRAPSRVTALLRDREGSVWFTTINNGLFRLRETPVQVIAGHRDSLACEVASVFGDAEGRVWLGTETYGLLRVLDRTARPVRIVGHEVVHAYAGIVDERGRMLLSIGGRLLDCDPRSDTVFTARAALDDSGAIAVMARDRAGRTWIGTLTGVLRRESDGRWAEPALPPGPPLALITQVAPDTQGRMWIAAERMGLVVFDGEASRRITAADGLPEGRIMGLAPAGPHSMWASVADVGLARVTFERGGRPVIATLGRADGLSDDTIVSLLDDGRGHLWMGTQHGLAAVAIADLESRLHGGPVLQPTVFDEGDGLLTRSFGLGAYRGADGRLWFGSKNGAVVVDPARALAETPTPAPILEEVTSARRTIEPAATGVWLASDERKFTVRFTALAFAAPQHLRFRYRLRGVDHDWVIAGAAREASYGNVPAGRHVFEVQAGNRAGGWNPTIARMDVIVAPAFHETWWFRLALVALMAWLASRLWRWRTDRFAQRQAALEALVQNRTRELESALAQVAAQTRALEELDQAKSRFFANISHEFRTPLTLTLGPIEDVLSGATGPVGEDTRLELDVALRNSRRLLQLVNEILDLAKLESGRLRLATREEDLRAALAEWAQAFHPLAERRRLRFEVRLGDTPLPVWFDRERLGKAVANLLGNAFKFTPEGRAVELVAAATPDGVRVTVIDHGPGIPAAERERIFERFYQVDESQRRLTPGTGIGLALAKELVEAHGGRIEVESTEGEGARFTIHLRSGRAHLSDAQIADGAGANVPAEPLVIDEGSAPRRGAAANDSAPSNADDDVTTILVVDDNAELRALVRRGLVDRYRVVEAQDGDEALAWARTTPPDLVVSDVMMPGMDGFELVEAFRADRDLDFIPIVLLTARAESEDRIAGLRKGADDYVEKPFRGDELRARVDNLLAMRHRLQQRFAAEGPAPVEFSVSSSAAPPSTGRVDAMFLEKLRTVIGEHLGDEDFNIGRLAERMHMDRTQLFRRTKELLQCAPADLLRRARLERAAELLREGTGGVGEVAYATGFKSVAHFSAAFRKQFAQTPTAYSRAAQETGTP